MIVMMMTKPNTTATRSLLGRCCSIINNHSRCRSSSSFMMRIETRDAHPRIARASSSTATTMPSERHYHPSQWRGRSRRISPPPLQRYFHRHYHPLNFVYSTTTTTATTATATATTTRFHSTTSSTSKAFDRNVKRLQRDNAARARKVWRPTAAAAAAADVDHQHHDDDSDTGDDDDDDIVDYEYFRQEMALRLVDRLDDIKRDEGFPLALDLGSGVGHLYTAISSEDAFDTAFEDDDAAAAATGGGGGIGGIRKMVLLDSSDGMLHVDDEVPLEEGAKERCEAYKLHADEEDKLPFPDGTFDLVLSSQSLHWVNDLPHLFQEVFRVLKPDGCFMFSMIGGATLPELRIALTLAELEREGGVGTHVGPFVELSDVGALMQNAGFALPTIDVDTVEISYPNAAVLMEHLQRMGEGNASLRRGHTGLDVFLAASCLYEELYPLESEEGTDVKASAQVIFAIGWTPHESQQKPLQRGSATHRVGDVVSKHKAGDP